MKRKESQKAKTAKYNGAKRETKEIDRKEKKMADLLVFKFRGEGTFLRLISDGRISQGPTTTAAADVGP